jgi:hypothetical protein
LQAVRSLKVTHDRVTSAIGLDPVNSAHVEAAPEPGSSVTLISAAVR